MKKIFISYHHLDSALVNALEDDLRSLGHDVWFDRELTGGQPWWDTICVAIRDCDVFVVALTPRWLDSVPSNLEFQYAMACRRVIVPVMLSSVNLTTSPTGLAELQYVTYIDRTRDAMGRLARAFMDIPSIPLPDPIPEPPPVPISPLLIRINAPSLPRDEQKSLVFDLKTLMADPRTRGQAQVYIEHLLKRKSELFADIAADLQAMTRRSRAGHFAGFSALILALVIGGLLGNQLKSCDKVATVQTAEIAEVNTATQSAKSPTSISIPPTSTFKLLRTFSGYVGGVHSVAFSPDGKTILTSGGDDTARLWDIATGKPILTFSGHTEYVCCVAFSPDGKTILTGSYDQAARLWDIVTGQTIIAFNAHTGALHSIAFAPDSKTALTGGDDAIARLWDIATGQTIQTFRGHTKMMQSLAFAPDGKTILTGNDDHTARLWDIATGQILQVFSGHTSEVLSVAFSPDGKTVLTGSTDETARLWDIVTGQTIRTFRGHIYTVTSVAFAPDGKTILTGSADDTVRLWEVSTGSLIQTRDGHSDSVYSVAFAPDGKTILTGSEDKTVRLWDISSLVSEP